MGLFGHYNSHWDDPLFRSGIKIQGEKCKWTWTDQGHKGLCDYYNTSCGQSMGYYQPDDKFKFCPYCGKEIKEVK